jgi:thymidylate synthase (FAD)
MVLDGYSARVIREWYTHIGGSPTRLQASTRYINYENIEHITPPKIKLNEKAREIYESLYVKISDAYKSLIDLGIPKEDVANTLPLGMTTTIVDHRNLRNLIDMAENRKCNRAYWEYRQLFKDICDALSEYSEEWAYLVKHYFKCKCDKLGYCPESRGCGKYPKENIARHER